MIEFLDIDGGTAPSRVIQKPAWNDVVSALDDLDGERYSILTMGHDEQSPPWLQICGGDAGLVTCQFMRDDLDDFLFLINSRGSRDEEVSLTIGGQTSDRWTREVVHDKRDITSCIRSFFESGAMDPAWRWQSSGGEINFGDGNERW